MGILIAFLPTISVLVTVMLGLIFISLGLWELRKGENRNQYVKFMLTGFLIIFIISPLIWVTILQLTFRF
ncbi:hypothetical protein [Virgibacillus sp. SK37]|uniref:hypothetical protein n=1 Tax=Virgibacillus sp. SK37 TaxID=403957 RepID=UPI0004D12AD9|nr:hypothetical protein [Virgibacillus sp. SK37]AIF45271.1 hypothetical protein X953_06325 [Virgibacillus sp. SK37]